MQELLKKLADLVSGAVISNIRAALSEPLYLVGGAVRDLAMGRECHDLDLASALPASVVKERLEAAGLRVIDTGLEHGTVTVLVADSHAELTTFRQPSARADSLF